ncbi:hypothetical protein BKA80DRAFT_261140 [Phyllosticta citrichinensis]
MELSVESDALLLLFLWPWSFAVVVLACSTGSGAGWLSCLIVWHCWFSSSSILMGRRSLTASRAFSGVSSSSLSSSEPVRSTNSTLRRFSS